MNIWNTTMLGTVDPNFANGINPFWGYSYAVLHNYSCAPCRANAYCPDPTQMQPINCPNNTYSYPGAITVDKCICPANSAWLQGTNCTCNQGLYKVTNTSAPLGGWQCNQCGTGTYGSSPGVCTQCTQGTYQSGTGMVGVSACISCSLGTYQPGGGRSACWSCPANSTTLLPGQTQMNHCSCGPGLGPFTPGEIAWYNFDTNACLVDASGNNLNLSPNSAAPCSSSSSVYGGSSASFLGTNYCMPCSS